MFQKGKKNPHSGGLNIMIVGCGKVGRTLADQLQEEDTDLTLIDTDPDVINDLTEDIDAMGIVGNGASINTDGGWCKDRRYHDCSNCF